MNDCAILVDRLSKRYRIKEKGTGKMYPNPLMRALASPFRYLLSSLQEPSPDEVVWVLKDVSFEITKGEVIGLIGRNGAGKSTLLKLLAKITEPTGGRAIVNGRVGSLLEVGTGFHPELTGRENIFLSGAILGMKKAEIDRKFDEIVAFAEVEKFIDMPVKRYSSGMYVRLAFSVAAHLEPEILLVDEVLAVGDLSFQKKCLERIKNLTINGMTIFLVSHNMAAIQSSCRRAIFLEAGQVAAIGDPVQVIDVYRQALQRSNGGSEINLLTGQAPASSSQELVQIRDFQMIAEDGTNRREFHFGEQIRIRIDLHANQRIDRPMINFGIRRGDGVVICNFNNWYDQFEVKYVEGDCYLEGWLPSLRLIPDFYEIHVLVWPWGGGHLTGNLEGSQPLAWVSFGDFRITGPALNSHDGVFQMPARKWRFGTPETFYESDEITGEDIYRAFDET